MFARGRQNRFDEVFYLSVHYCTSVRLCRWRGCASCCIFGYSLNFVRNTGYVEISMEQLIVNVPVRLLCFWGMSIEIFVLFFSPAGLAHPHIWTPYDQMILKITLYKSSLLFRDNLELRPRSQSNCLNLISNCLRFAWMCVFQVSRWSRWRLIYLTSVVTGMGALLNVKSGHMLLRVVNVICTDLAWFTFIRHRVYHSARELIWVCRCRIADTGSSLTDSTATSSANDAIVVFPALGMSAVQIKNCIGPRTLPYGTPASIG